MSNNPHIHIPASKDTLFMRGFSYRQDIEHIREFFARECGGRNTVEFFKDDGNDQLFLALRFESKEIAKDVMHRFNDVDILGDRITMTWYKDLRRARQPYPAENFRRPAYRSNYDNYSDYRERTMYASRSGYNKPRYQQVASRPRRYTRSSSHSRSRSLTRSISASRSRSRSSSHSYDSRENKKKRISEVKKTKGQKKNDLDFESSHSDTSQPKAKKLVGDNGEGDISPLLSKKTSKSGKSKEPLDTTNEGEASDVNDFPTDSAASQMLSKLKQPSAVKSSVQKKQQAALLNKMTNEEKMDVGTEESEVKKTVAAPKQKKLNHSDVEESSPSNINLPPPNNGPARNKPSFEEEEDRVGRNRRAAPEDFSGGDFESDINKRTKYEETVYDADAKMRKRQDTSMQRGMMGMSHDKILLIKQKKEEIEKAYRQDCETFATVTKLLISKDPELEDKIQMSLRENLKDIGQRCIQELREFVERVKNDDEI